ncbi:hypothetical protein HHK36_020220 [Tetracentron sinense]|uniref:Rapid ALkalinization Factor n=1 Tax=Tetracentron sinense TaxID=13715 RepID=A0A835D864_TETSI|nr:hypothetical protein HHK36_020220 [Tetracentron sinense]
MAKPKTKSLSMKNLYFILLLLKTHILASNGFHVLGSKSMRNKEIDVPMRRDCTGKMGECFWETEAEMDSETNRRVLVLQKKYISYETLKKDIVPCSRPGASYYNCEARGQANPYTRGCEVITGCARNIRDIKS